MLWLLPFLCSGAICWLNRDRIVAVATPPRAVTRPAFAAGSFATPYLLPRAAAGYGSTPYGTGPLLLPQAGSPAASPFAYAGAPLEPFMSAVAPAPIAPAMGQAGPIALLRCSADGCMVRPEPRPWDDATLGRMPGAFTAPKDFPVYVLSYGPVGWAHVLVEHPDEGAVEGWIETRSLTDAPASTPSPPSMASAATPTPSGVPATGEVVNGRDEAMARHLQYMQKRPRAAAPPAPPPRRRVK